MALRARGVEPAVGLIGDGVGAERDAAVERRAAPPRPGGSRAGRLRVRDGRRRGGQAHAGIETDGMPGQLAQGCSRLGCERIARNQAPACVNVFFAFGARATISMRLPRTAKSWPTSRPASPSLDSLRRQIDALDDRMQDLLIGARRAGRGDRRPEARRQFAPFRPGREAQILRRLVARHRGRFPRPALVRIWREILSGTVAMQADLVGRRRARAAGTWRATISAAACR